MKWNGFFCRLKKNLKNETYKKTTTVTYQGKRTRLKKISSRPCFYFFALGFSFLMSFYSRFSADRPWCPTLGDLRQILETRPDFRQENGDSMQFLCNFYAISMKPYKSIYSLFCQAFVVQCSVIVVCSRYEKYNTHTKISSL